MRWLGSGETTHRLDALNIADRRGTRLMADKVLLGRFGTCSCHARPCDHVSSDFSSYLVHNPGSAVWPRSSIVPRSPPTP